MQQSERPRRTENSATTDVNNKNNYNSNHNSNNNNQILGRWRCKTRDQGPDNKSAARTSLIAASARANRASNFSSHGSGRWLAIFFCCSVLMYST